MDYLEAPLVFWLLVGYFRQNEMEHIKAEGIFRVTGNDAKITELELHIS